MLTCLVPNLLLEAEFYYLDPQILEHGRRRDGSSLQRPLSDLGAHADLRLAYSFHPYRCRPTRLEPGTIPLLDLRQASRCTACCPSTVYSPTPSEYDSARLLLAERLCTVGPNSIRRRTSGTHYVLRKDRQVMLFTRTRAVVSRPSTLSWKTRC